jgi:hypothetical protein
MPLIPLGVKAFSLSPKRPHHLWFPPNLLNNGYRVPFLAIKQLGREVSCTLPLSAKVKNEWIYISDPPYKPSWRAEGKLYFFRLFNGAVSN